jgi:hypothetical protein
MYANMLHASRPMQKINLLIDLHLSLSEKYIQGSLSLAFVTDRSFKFLR